MSKHRMPPRKRLDAGILLIVAAVCLAIAVLVAVASGAPPVSDEMRHPPVAAESLSEPLWHHPPVVWVAPPVVHHHQPLTVASHQAYAPASPSTPVYTSDPRSYAASQMSAYGWSQDQMSGCLVPLWNQESGWDVHAASNSGAYGIPQALPGYKMASAGSDWHDNPVTQINWGLGYIQTTYGSPCNAWGHEQADGWY